MSAMPVCAAFIRGHEAYTQGKPVWVNPYRWSAPARTAEGTARLQWARGWCRAWIADGCRASRWPEMSYSAAVVEHQLIRLLEPAAALSPPSTVVSGKGL
jgi:hypothetical protein